ncbi:MAG: HNH endonuclease signature motif containing protein [Elusimicrobia bacterium]|nr:HNH endonuclease signature motif containing protein [Elusimicrobiota bacterium]
MTPISEILRRCVISSDDELFHRLEDGTLSERSHLVETLAIIGELHERRAALPRGFSSLFVYCTQRLGYCERTAYRRIAAAKACRSFPLILELLRSGKIHLTAIVLLREHLTPENHESVLARAEGASMDQLKRMAASMSPMQAAPTERTRVIAVIDKERLFGGLEASTGAGEQSGLAFPPAPPLMFRTEHQFTLGDAAEAKLMRARELLAHKFPMGDLESIFEAALDSLLDAVDPSRRKARPDAEPRPLADQTRRIPEWVRRKVRDRDEDRCAFVSREGIRCGERRFLQFDHVVPWSLGGRSDDPANVRQLCAAHNRWAWRHAFVTRS